MTKSHSKVLSDMLESHAVHDFCLVGPKVSHVRHIMFASVCNASRLFLLVFFIATFQLILNYKLKVVVCFCALHLLRGEFIIISLISNI